VKGEENTGRRTEKREKREEGREIEGEGDEMRKDEMDGNRRRCAPRGLGRHSGSWVVTMPQAKRLCDYDEGWIEDDEDVGGSRERPRGCRHAGTDSWWEGKVTTQSGRCRWNGVQGQRNEREERERERERERQKGCMPWEQYTSPWPPPTEVHDTKALSGPPLPSPPSCTSSCSSFKFAFKHLGVPFL